MRPALLAVTLLTVFPTPDDDTMEVMHELSGEAPGALFGASVSGVGDVNSDGLGDFVVGIPGDDTVGKDAGAARVYAGRKGELLFEVFGEEPGDRFGWCVDWAGDVDNNGFDDLIVGAPDHDDGRGVVYVFSGKDGELIHRLEGERKGDHFGHSASGAGDVDSDGFGDLVVGAPYHDPKKKLQDAGLAVIYSGKKGKELHVLKGEQAGELFGWSVSSAGDVNIDSFSDVIVGAPGGRAKKRAPATGVARIFHGKKGRLLYTLVGTKEGDGFGYSVHSAGDTDSDGAGDVIVGCFTSPGYAVVYSGRKGIERHRFEGTQKGEHFGQVVGGAGDVNRDSYSDVVVGIPASPAPGEKAGQDGEGQARVQVFSGKTGELIFELLGEGGQDHLGCSVAGAGNLDGDASSEIIVGADQFGIRGGYVRVYRLR